MRRRSLSFRWHLVAFGLVVLVPMLIAGAGIAALYVTAERSSLQNQMLGTARDVRSAVDRQLDGAIATLRTLALSPHLQQDLATFHGLALQVSELFPGAIIGLRRADGRPVLNTAVPFGGDLQANADPVLLQADSEAVRTGQPTVSDLYRGAVTERLFVAVVNPVTIEGQPHVLSLAIPPESILRTVLSGRTFPAEWLVVITDRHHRVIARTRDHERFRGATVSPDFVAQLGGHEGFFNSATLDGVQVLDAYTRSLVSAWVVTVAAPVSSASAPLMRALTATSVFAALGVLCSICFALAYSGYITPPIMALQKAALSLARRQPLPSMKTGISELDAVSDAVVSASADLIAQDNANKTLMEELNHRVKNTLSAVQSIALQTAAQAQSQQDFMAAFSGRLVALAKAHDALSATGWINADLRDLAMRVCAPISGEERLVLKGAAIQLPPRVILTLGLVLHELATNAAKYGALTVPGGRVTVSWSLRRQQPGSSSLELRWMESGGPPPQTPARRGFGTRFILNSIEQDLRGSAALDFTGAGFVFQADIPLGLQAPARMDSASTSQPAVARDPQGQVEQHLVAARPARE